MKRYLVFSEPGVASIKRATLGILERLTALEDAETEIVFVGRPEQAEFALLTPYKLKRVNILKGIAPDNYSPEAHAFALQTLIKNNDYDIVFSGATSMAQDIFPRLSIEFKTGLASGVKDFYLKGEKVFGVKEIYGGKYLTDIEIIGQKPRFITVKPGALKISARDDYYDLDTVENTVAECAILTKRVKVKRHPSRRPPIDTADIVVAGGRGIGEASKLNILEQLADTLGAALGASGGAIGNDFAPREYLVGQTGATISPLLYIGCGISGAIQHLSGIRHAKYILAINTDVNAPLMQIADHAIVGDFAEIVPAMIRQLNAKKE